MQGKQRESQPQWQPVTQLSLIVHNIDGMLESASEQYETLQLAKPKPFVLDDYTVGRVIQVFTTQQGDLWLFDEQLGKGTTDQRAAPGGGTAGRPDAPAARGGERYPAPSRAVARAHDRKGAGQK